MFQLHSPRPVRNIRRNSHHFHKTLVSGIAVLELLREVNQLFHRLRKGINIQKKGNQICHTDLTVGNQHCAGYQHHNGYQCGQGAETGMIAGHVAVTVLFGRQKSLISFFKLVQFHFLIGKGFHHPDAGQVILNLAVDFCDFYPVPLKSPFHPGIKIHGVHQHYRYKGKRYHGEFHINIQ